MRVTLELQHEPLGGAVEVDDEAAEDVLATEFEAQYAAVAKQRPRVALSGSRGPSQLGRECDLLCPCNASERVHHTMVTCSAGVVLTPLARAGPKRCAVLTPVPLSTDVERGTNGGPQGIDLSVPSPLSAYAERGTGGEDKCS